MLIDIFLWFVYAALIGSAFVIACDIIATR